jgi:hypothetical protein
MNRAIWRKYLSSGAPGISGPSFLAATWKVSGELFGLSLGAVNRIILNLCGGTVAFSPQQFWTSPVVHGAFEGFQSVDLTFRLAIAPGHLDGVFDCLKVSVQCPGEANDGR